jgi:hypothetical protein
LSDNCIASLSNLFKRRRVIKNRIMKINILIINIYGSKGKIFSISVELQIPIINGYFIILRLILCKLVTSDVNIKR